LCGKLYCSSLPLLQFRTVVGMGIAVGLNILARLNLRRQKLNASDFVSI
jgi:hypothetical protein